MKLLTLSKSNFYKVVLFSGVLLGSGLAFANGNGNGNGNAFPTSVLAVNPASMTIVINNNTPNALNFKNVIYDNVVGGKTLPDSQLELNSSLKMKVAEPDASADVYIPVYIQGKFVCTAHIKYNHNHQDISGKVIKGAGAGGVHAYNSKPKYMCATFVEGHGINGRVRLNVWTRP